MALFTRNPLTPDQIQMIMEETGCSKSQAISRAKKAVKRKVGVDYFLNQQLYRMDDKELSRYLRKTSPRKYVEALSNRRPETDYEVYRQMQRARSEFGIPYSIFAKKRLVNSSDSRLMKVKANSEKKADKAISNIADSLAISNDEAQKIVDRIKSKFGYSAREIYTYRLYAMNDSEIAKYKAHSKDHTKEVREKIAKKTGWSDSQIRAHISRCNIDFGVDASMYYCCKCYELDDSQLARIGNMADSKRISAKYNKGYDQLLYNKQLFNETYRDYLGRKFWINRDTSFEEFKEFAEGLSEIFCKPIDSSIGRGTYKYDLSEKDLEDVYEHFMNEPKYLFEESISQHPEMAKFNPGSINTVRLFTILDKGKFYPFMSFVRFGVNDFIDNFSSGGLACAVDPETGIIRTNAANKAAEEYEVHPISKIKFKGFQIPHWDKVLERTEAALRSVEGVNYVGWDIAIQDDDVVFIEGNSTPDFGVQQAACITEGELIRPQYFQFVGENVYGKLFDKVQDVMATIGCSEQQAINRLVEAGKNDLDYDFLKDQDICLLKVYQIRRYANDKEKRELVDQFAKDNDLTVGKAYLKLNSPSN